MRESSPRFRLYIDESGDHTYNLLHDVAHRYLALLSVWFRQADHYIAFADDLERFKREVFGPRPDRPVVLHRSDIINRKGPFGLLRDAGVRAEFDEGLLRVVGTAEFKIVCVLIDKSTHSEKRAGLFHPYHHCLAAMLDRYSRWLNHNNAVGDVMAESRGREEDLQLKQAYLRVYESGTLMLSHEQHQRALTTREIKLQAKRANIAGLQLADILAYPVKQACLIESNCITDPGDVFGKRAHCAPSRTSSTVTSGRASCRDRARYGSEMKRPPAGGSSHASPHGLSTCGLPHWLHDIPCEANSQDGS